MKKQHHYSDHEHSDHQKANPPLAIIGIGCRFPGNADSPKKFWEMMRNEVDAIGLVPKERWDVRKYFDEDIDKIGKSYVKEGGFLSHDIEKFDADFFNISPREASVMDPQQRILLEVTWEAIENSGITLDYLQAVKTGVFIGGFCLDSKLIQYNHLNKYFINSHTAAGASMTILANRISHAFDFTGPSMSIDTACSSSLVATHTACQSIWNNDTDIAVVGGVNIMLSPEYFISMSKARLLSKKARCFAFDERASGYVRGEGCGIVIIKPLEAALKDNDRIYSVIVGSGVNQDGRTAGISLPSAKAQEKLIRHVYAKAKVSFDQINYVEAHGTGTKQGDSAEVTALSNVFNNVNHKCLLGSVKTNIGHLEAAAGVAGLIKTSLCLYERAIPANLHYVTPNSSIPFEKINLSVSDKYQTLSGSNNQDAIYAGVNSFGYGGTNAHVLLKSVSQSQLNKKTIQWPIIYSISARSENALIRMAKSHAEFLENINECDMADVIYSLGCRKTHHHYRSALVAGDIESLKQSLQQFNAHENLSSILVKQSVTELNKKLVFVYSGMGPQWNGMGCQLLETNKIFKEFVQKCDVIFKRFSGWSILQELTKIESESTLKIMPTEIAQPLNFVLQVGITEILKTYGVNPDCVIGHSVGEVSAAYVSGALSLEDALLVSYHRSRLQRLCVGHDGMLAANISAEKADVLIKRWSAVNLAAINSHEAIVLAGPSFDLKEISAELTNTGIFNRMLKTEIAYHSDSMEMIHDDLLDSLKLISPVKTNIAMCSTATGEIVHGEELNANYWWKNVRNTVLFEQAVSRVLSQNDFNVLLEIGPHPVLYQYMLEQVEKEKCEGKVLYSLRRNQSEQFSISSLIAKLYAIGFNLDWKKIIPFEGKHIDLPAYPWQHNKYTLENDNTYFEKHVESPYLFLSNHIDSPRKSWKVELTEGFFPYLSDHQLDNNVVFPAAGYIEAGLQIANFASELDKFEIKNISFKKLLVVDPKKIQTVVSEFDDVENTFKIWSSESDDNSSISWNCHASGEITKSTRTNKKISIDSLKLKCNKKLETSLFYSLFDGNGLKYGSSFQGIQSLWQLDGNELLVYISNPNKAEPDANYIIHPIILDSAFQSIMALTEDLSGLNSYIPTHLGNFYYYKPIKNSVWAHVCITDKTAETITVAISLYDEDGDAVCDIENLTCRQFSFETAAVKKNNLLSKLYKPQWYLDKNAAVDTANPDNIIIFNTSQDAISKSLEARLFKSNLIAKTFYDEKLFALYIENVSSLHVTFLYVMPKNNQNEVLESVDERISFHAIKITKIIRALSKSSIQNINFIFIGNDSHIVKNTDGGKNLLSSSLAGLVFLINNEFPKIKAQNIDLSADPVESDYLSVIDVIKTDATDIAIRNSEKYLLHFEKNSKHTEISKINFDVNATYLITGGSSGFGLELARWLGLNGARHIVLVSRRGVTTHYAEHVVDKLKQHGISIYIYSVDVSNFDDVQSLVKKIHTPQFPLKGIFHCAMTLEDVSLADISKKQYDTVISPKVNGAINLHRATLDINLDYFVMTSSISSLIGNSGQANYIVANAFLDAFSHYRRKQGLAATTINLGVLSDSGVISRNEQLAKYMDSLAITASSTKETINALSATLEDDVTQNAIFDFDWIKWSKLNFTISNSDRFKNIIKEKSIISEIVIHNEVDADYSVDENVSKNKITNVVLDCVSSVLKFPAADINLKRSINDMGIDSLMIAELRNQLISHFEIDFSIVDLLKGVSIHQIVSDICERKIAV